MAMATADAGWARSFEWRACVRMPVPAWSVGFILTAALISVYALAELFYGPLDPDDVKVIGPLTDTQLGFALSSAVAGYALSAGAAIAAGNASDLNTLRLSGTLEGLEQPSLRTGRIVGVCGLVASVAFMASVDPPARAVLLLRTWSLDGFLSIVSVSIAFWLATRAAWFTLAELNAVAQAAGNVLDVDPLDHERFEPLGRMALRASLLWAGMAAISTLSLTITGGSPAEVVASAFLFAVAVGSFLIPMNGVHHKLHDAKHAELRRVRSEIRRDREAVASLGSDSAAAAQRLPGLLAFEARLEDAREWPFDAPTLRGFGIVLLLPLMSWLGGALVERMVDAALD